MVDLHEELIVEVLIRLPVKSLLRFRCVSKSWCALIDGQQFIDYHCQHSINTQTNLHVFFSSDIAGSLAYIYSLAFDEVFNKPFTKFNNQFTSTKGYKIMGSCNGLLCLSHSLGLGRDEDKELILWNPFTRRYKKLPTASVNGLHRSQLGKFRYGFGYDHVSNDYKVVLIYQFRNQFNMDYVSEAHVYSLRLNSWKRAKDFPYMGRVLKDSDCCVNGALHWFVSSTKRHSWSIVAFDLGIEEFDLLPLPSFKNRDDDIEPKLLTVLDGRLCSVELYDSDIVEVWMMKQYGERESWCKMHLLKLDGYRYDHVKFLSYSKNGERLLLEVKQEDLSWYDLKKKKHMIIYRFGDELLPYFNAHMCLECLASLGPGSEFDGTEQKSPKVECR